MKRAVIAVINLKVVEMIHKKNAKKVWLEKCFDDFINKSFVNIKNSNSI